jgi:hypothetical protein
MAGNPQDLVEARRILQLIWDESGASVDSELAAGDAWLSDGPYGDVLAQAEERSRGADNRVSLRALFQAACELRDQHRQPLAVAV